MSLFKNPSFKLSHYLALVALIVSPLAWADEVITFTTHGSPGYYVNEQLNPDLTLKRGMTYQIKMETPGHPLWIKTLLGPGKDNAYNNGVTGNGTDRGTITFVVPSNAPDHLIYNCEYHVVMHGQINISN